MLLEVVNGKNVHGALLDSESNRSANFVNCIIS